MSEVAGRIVWKLARRHSWGSPIPADHLLQLASGTEDHDEMARVLEDVVLDLPFVAKSSAGIFIPNGQDAHVETANWLRDHTELDEMAIKATLSRLPAEWPEEQ